MSTISSMKFALQQITIYAGLFILITGIIGGTFNIIIFTTLKTFRETTCAFYLTFASIIGIGQIMTGLFVRILSDGFLIDPRKISWFCKIYFFGANWCLAVWLTSICLATIDQFLSMSKYRHLSTIRLARRYIIITCIFWLMYSCILFVYWDAPSGTCRVINSNYANYYSHFTLPILYGCLPIVVMITFSLLAFYKARMLTKQRINIVRLSRDRQLTAMILVYTIFIIISIIPFTSFYVYTLNIYITDQNQLALNELIFTITILIQYSIYSIGFYVFCCVSERFRKQLVYVLVNIFISRWQQRINNPNNNQVMPSIEVTFHKS